MFRLVFAVGLALVLLTFVIWNPFSGGDQTIRSIHQAFSATRALDVPDWELVRVRETRQGRLRERYRPWLPHDSRWELLTINGYPASPPQRASYRKEPREHINLGHLWAVLKSGDVSLKQELSHRLVYTFLVGPRHARLLGISGAARGKLVISSLTGLLEAVEVEAAVHQDVGTSPGSV